MAILPRCTTGGIATVLTTFSPPLTGWTTVTGGAGGTAPVAGDLVLVLSQIGVVNDTWSQSAGTTWADGSSGPDNNGGASSMTSMVVARNWTGAETAPTFGWGSSGRGTWSAIAIAPDAGNTCSIDVLGTVKKDTTAATTHTASAATTANTVLSLIYMALKAGASAATAISISAEPTSWTQTGFQGQVGSASTASEAGDMAYRASQTGTITPTAATVNVSTASNLYHILIKQTPIPISVIPDVVMAAHR